MGTIVSNMYDEIKLHGSWEAYVEFRDIDLKKVEALPDQGDIPYFPDPEVIDSTTSNRHTTGLFIFDDLELKEEIIEKFKGIRSQI